MSSKVYVWVFYVVLSAVLCIASSNLKTED